VAEEPGGKLQDLKAADRCRELLDAASARFAAGEIRASAGLALEAGELAARSGLAGMLVEAALVVDGIPDATTSATVEHLSRQALDTPDLAPAARARLEAQLAVALHHRERLADSADHAATAGRLATASGDQGARASSLHADLLSIAGNDRGPRMTELAREMLDAASSAHSPEAELAARSWRIEALMRSGDTTAARHEVDSLDVLAARTGAPLARWNALLARAGVDQAVGRFADADRSARAARIALPAGQRHQSEPLFIAQAMLIATDRGVAPPEIGQVREHAIGSDVIAMAMTARFDLEAGDRARALASFAALRSRIGLVALDRRGLPTLAAAADLAIAADDQAAAAEIEARLLPFAGMMIAGSLGAVGPVDLHLAGIALLQGHPDAALDHAQVAAEVASRGGFVPAHARAQLAIARSARARDGAGDGLRARRAAEVAGSVARQLGMRSIEARARDLLVALDPGTRLSRREEEVASLVASGHSNRAIAVALGLSERTVESHVQHILGKLGLHTRAQVAAWMARSGSAGGGGT
jgi:DNA-binding CsgD family transcriptional regulator